MGEIMGKWKKKKIIWRVKNSKRLSLKKRRIKKHNIGSFYNHENSTTPKYTEKFTANAPRVLSAILNPEEVNNFFSSIINEIKLKKYNELFFFNLSNVEVLTIDAIMYVLAIIRNIKGREIFKYIFKGNQPLNKEANKLLLESGFFKYVNTNNPKLYRLNKNIQITSMNFVDGETASYICDFVNTKCKTKMSFTDELYEIIIELMANTIQHAYNDKEILTVNQWYIYVGVRENILQFVFLDTGEGIPQTVNKKAIEKFGDLFNANKNDSYYIMSALNGEWRSKTEEKYRGKGLPFVFSFSKRDEICNYTILSGKAVVKIGKEGIISYTNLNNRIFGTLYYWEIQKDRIKEEYYLDSNKNL